MALVAQMVERKTLNLVVVGSSPTEGAFFWFGSTALSQVFEPKPKTQSSIMKWNYDYHNSFRGAVGSAWVS